MKYTDALVEDILREHKKHLIEEFQTILRTLHDHTFDPISNMERLRWIRFEIEKELKKWEARK